jgi:L-lactate dehydrogenase complex protein LldG
VDSRSQILHSIERAQVGNFEYVRPLVVERSPSLEAFCEAVADYRAVVHRVDQGDLISTIRMVLDGKRGVVPAGILDDWQKALSHFIEDVPSADAVGLSYEELDRAEATLTTCAVGIVETGTIVLDGGAGQGRRAISLIPDHHVCVIFEEQIVASVEQAVQVLESSIKAGRPLTWISGPSATSDIELVRVEGVHGPRTLEVIVVSKSR